jgi:hypothetical protein
MPTIFCKRISKLRKNRKHQSGPKCMAKMYTALQEAAHGEHLRYVYVYCVELPTRFFEHFQNSANFKYITIFPPPSPSPLSLPHHTLASFRIYRKMPTLFASSATQREDRLRGMKRKALLQLGGGGGEKNETKKRGGYAMFNIPRQQ